MNQVAQSIQGDRLESLARQKCLDAGLEPLADFADQSRRLDGSLKALERVAGDAAGRSVARLRQELNQFEPSITILGQVKSGKTTLVNALAGWSDLLPSDVNPWTSVVTSLHLIPGAHRKEIGARFQLMKADEWDRLLTKGGRLGELAQRAGASGELEKIRQQIEMMREKSRRRLGKRFELLLGQEHEYGYFDRNLLERYVCLGDDFLMDGDAATEGKQGWFADITRSADLYLHCQSMPFPLCIRDTPGVNDTFLMREQVSIAAVRDSRICVVVLSAHQALTSIDMGLIRLISNLQSRDVIIFVNRVDELQNLAVQVPEIERSIRETLAAHKGPTDAKIIFGSAYWANKVLSENIEDLPPASAAALVNWAETAIVDQELGMSPAEMVWKLSGLPALNRAVADRIVSSLGNPHLRRVASAAVMIAGGLEAANTVRVAGTQANATFSMPEVMRQMEDLIRQQTTALTQELSGITSAYHGRADRAHANFLERATHSLVKHLEYRGEDQIWEYDPAGLRILLKSAYSVYAARAQSSANARYKLAVQEVAELLYTSFGEVVAGMELPLPEAPEAPAPVSLAQTIVLDFNDGWWRSWWRRTRGYKAFSERFHAMISAETQGFIAQFKTIPPADFNASLEVTLKTFLDQSRDIVAEIGNCGTDRDRLQRLGVGAEEAARKKLIESLITELRDQAEQVHKEVRPS